MYNTYMKSLIKYALELEIESINTFSGYKGGDIICFKSSNLKHINLIKKYCFKLEISTNIKQRRDIIEIYCAFGIDRYAMDDNDDEIYDLVE